ncbi:aldo/keto reductase [Balneolaceae bacterium ANBcel3]|nr:aldo/keto reductase [Balneolaceae bacterium ANBcel3]
MKYIEINKQKIPALGFGTFGLKGEAGVKTIVEAIQMGYHHIDTAESYYNEEETGKAIKKASVPRDNLFLTTKFINESLSGKNLPQEMEASLKRLKTDYVDLLLIHWPSKTIPLEETLGAMNRLKEEGKIRNIGVSNFTTALLKEAKKTDIPIITNQVEYHVYLSQEKLLTYMRENGLFLTAYSPVARGKVLDDQTLVNIGKKHNKNAVQIALKWLISQDDVAAIPKASHPEKCRSNLDIFDFELDEEDVSTINRLEKHHRLIDVPGLSPEWD